MSDSTSPISSAVGWLQSILLGTLAITVAIVAIASLGFLMMTGRIDFRRAAQLVLGCFIIFGASTIATGILAAVSDGGGQPYMAQAASPPPLLPSPPPAAAQSTSYDPYAGAALPPR